MNSKQVVN